MRIKQLELNGFKSFMERTVLELPSGVTAIVGPNGCGKSNIVDAIRWLLGEQSPRHLRGAAMEDVIFNGNSEYGPLGMAEVSLLLERDDEDFARAAADGTLDGEPAGDGLPPELAKLSEIVVTRRYFRSGESEYFINRAPCRLRDITELFLGTGVGSRAYAIIEQGRVEQIVSAKPDELRLFLEEAAGTTRFRSRKVSAERKMERTRDNLMRVQDVLRELERQMTSLERQARRAEEYHRIKGELRELDLRVMARRHRTWTDDVASATARLDALLATDAALQDEIRRSRGATAEAQAARAAQEERLREVDVELAAARVAAGEAQSRADTLAARGDELAARATTGAAEAEALECRLAALRAEAVHLAGQVETLAAEQPAAEGELAALEARLGELADAGAPLERDVETAKDRLLERLAEESRLRNVAEALRRRRLDLDGRRRKLDDMQRELGARLAANAQAAEAARTAAAALGARRTALEDERRALADRHRAFVATEAERIATVEQLRMEATQLRMRAESLRELQARYEGCTRGVASLVARDADRVAVLASVLRVPPALERAVAAALGARLTHLVVDDTQRAIGAIAWLRETGGGSATVVPRDPERRAPVIVPSGQRLVDAIEVDGPHWALAEALLGDVIVADDMASALTLWRAATTPVTVVTREGEAIDALGAVTGGSEPPLEETLLARERELRELEEARHGAAARLEGGEADLARARSAVAEASARMAGLEEALQGIRVELVAAEKDRERLEAERERIAAELEVGALEAGGLAGEDGEVAGELATLAARVEDMAADVERRRDDLAVRQAALGRWREEHAAAEQRRMAAAVRAAAVAERLRAVRAESSRCATAVAELEERLAAVRRAVSEARAGSEQAQRDAADAAAAHRRSAALAAERGQEREGLRAAIAESERLLSADDAAEQVAREQLDGVRDERSRVEIALTERRMALEHLAAQLLERYELGTEALRDVPTEEDGQDAEREARAEALRARLTRLGDVNPAALAELEELRERHAFLEAQRVDLERSLDDLKRTIAKLTRTSRQRFEETFAAANEKLAEVFPKLFPSGLARLELVTPEEGGEPGVEIVVQPAGKKLQSLTLLSGGEKALTAVALILSLFLIRPTPFCILDEVDAPLDEANIGRFNQLVRDMAQASQFVLITHNRRTMEVAHTLYGITMQLAGVSKVVAVRLREAA
jgi:chromosome segregation protein